ncbi:hypothetical protein [Tabrizicola sp.]|uniref:hypothetical protein n=1 Tax=Tabrizicola sp. TaxID=2005166 RepID=UPI0027358805|nr:hypothetical protein [Tabrizicola sp.]MDP3195683.1 hypothetical protein [Tabrizicola sp.]
MERILLDLSATSVSGAIELSLVLVFFFVFTLIVTIISEVLKAVGVENSYASSISLLFVNGMPAAVLALGLVVLDFFVDDQSLRDTGTAVYLTPLRSFVVCMKLSTIILLSGCAAYFLVRTFRRGLSQ